MRASSSWRREDAAVLEEEVRSEYQALRTAPSRATRLQPHLSHPPCFPQSTNNPCHNPLRPRASRPPRPPPSTSPSSPTPPPNGHHRPHHPLDRHRCRARPPPRLPPAPPDPSGALAAAQKLPVRSDLSAVHADAHGEVHLQCVAAPPPPPLPSPPPGSPGSRGGGEQSQKAPARASER